MLRTYYNKKGYIVEYFLKKKNKNNKENRQG